MTKILCFIFTSLLFGKTSFAQTINYLDSSQKGVSFRGLSVVTNDVFWVSGSKGTVGKTTDGGQHFEWMKPKGFEKRDFRDIEAFDDKTAIIMGVDSPGVILKTIDGGANWKVVYRNDTHGIFLDAMAFKDNRFGVCVGDPIGNHFWLIETNNQGDSWTEVPMLFRPEAEIGEACFASSGTNIQFLNGTKPTYAFVSGGKKTRLFFVVESLYVDMLDPITTLNLVQGQETTGANSLAMNNKYIAVAGGDFNNYKKNDSTFIYTTGSPKDWKQSIQKPFGYKSCVIFKDDKTLIATGISGTDISLQSPAYWKHFSEEPFHVVQKAKQGTAVYLAGGNGRIAKIIF
jgi:hypothetical protein